MSDQTKYMAMQAAANITGGYNRTPKVAGGGALPGMRGPDLKGWNDLMKPVYDQPYDAGYGMITQPTINAIQRLQFLPRAYNVITKR